MIVLLLVEYHSPGIVSRGEFVVDLEEIIQKLQCFFQSILLLVEQTEIVHHVNIFGLDRQCSLVVCLFLLKKTQLIIADGSIAEGLYVIAIQLDGLSVVPNGLVVLL